MDTQRIIKADSMRQAGQKVVFNFEDFHQHCDAELQRSQVQANQNIEESQKQARSIEKRAEAKGYNAGYAAGLKKANEEIQQQVNALTKQAIDKGLANKFNIVDSLTVAISEAKLRWLAHWERIAIEFSVMIAKKVIHSEITKRPDISREMIRSVLEVISAEERVVVRLHPDDAKYFQESEQDPTVSAPFHQLVEFKSDPSLSPGDCLAEMEFGVLDGRVDTQLKRIQDELCPIIENENE